MSVDILSWLVKETLTSRKGMLLEECKLVNFRINMLHLQTVLIEQPGRGSQYRMQVSNMLKENFIFCPTKANTYLAIEMNLNNA